MKEYALIVIVIASLMLFFVNTVVKPTAKVMNQRTEQINNILKGY